MGVTLQTAQLTAGVDPALQVSVDLRWGNRAMGVQAPDLGTALCRGRVQPWGSLGGFPRGISGTPVCLDQS